MPLLSRRILLRTGAAATIAGVAAVAGLETGVIPGRAKVHDVLGLSGPDGVVPDVPSGPVESGTFESAARRTTVGYSIIRPPGSSGELPVVLALHGRGGDHTSAIGDLGMDRYLTAAMQSGTPPFAVATVDGGRDNYWHPRATGDDPLRMLSAEFLPLLAKRGLRTERVGVLGWSMGGYGALLWGGRSAIAIGAMSPALWRRYDDDVAAGAFDGAGDFAQYQVFGRPLENVAVRIDCGRDDPFADAAGALRRELHAAGGQQPGAHTGGYWRRMLPEQLRFLGEKLAH